MSPRFKELNEEFRGPEYGVFLDLLKTCEDREIPVERFSQYHFRMGNYDLWPISNRWREVCTTENPLTGVKSEIGIYRLKELL